MARIRHQVLNWLFRLACAICILPVNFLPQSLFARNFNISTNPFVYWTLKTVLHCIFLHVVFIVCILQTFIFSINVQKSMDFIPWPLQNFFCLSYFIHGKTNSITDSVVVNAWLHGDCATACSHEATMDLLVAATRSRDHEIAPYRRIKLKFNFSSCEYF